MFRQAAPEHTIGEVVLWDVDLGQLRRVLPIDLKHELIDGLSPTELSSESLCSTCFSPCVEALACSGINTVFLLDASTGKELCKPVEMRLERGSGARCIAWPPRGRLMAAVVVVVLVEAEAAA